MDELLAVQVAQSWIDAVLDGKARTAWRLTDSALRLALVQEWLDWGGPDLLAVKVRGRDAVASDLASEEPRLAEFDALTYRLFENWAPMLHRIRPCAVALGDEIGVGLQEVALVALSSSNRHTAVLRQVAGRWRIAAFGGRVLPTPGSPPRLGSTIGAGQAPVRRIA